MRVGRTVSRLSCLAVVMLTLLFTVPAYALNRNDMFSELDKLNTNWNDISIDLWINDLENEPFPGVKVGDRLIYRATTDRPAFFVLILVDARGNVAVLKPDARAVSQTVGASQSLVFPNEEESVTGQNIIEQAEPLGKDTIYLLVSNQHLPTSMFGFEVHADYVSYGVDIAKVRNLVTRLNSYSESLKLASARYVYYVDSDTQFSTRGIRRTISARVEEIEVATSSVTSTNADSTIDANPVKSSPIVINDINFEFDSDVLTTKGINQLEILGSELVDRQGQNDLPRILLTGHTDSSGLAEYNVTLSQKRSTASKRFLVDEFGLPAKYIDTHGLGETVPIDSNETRTGREKNRRVEVEVMK